MDLIYADKNRVEIGVLNGYGLDIAFGYSENDFELKMSQSNNELEIGGYVYIEQTEYGGIIDAIALETSTQTITYSGRTWHGMIENKILCPDANQDYLILEGEANAVIKKVLNRIGLSDMFTSVDADSGIYINTTYIRYENAYTALLKMMQSAGAKLRIEFLGGYVYLEAVNLINFANDEEWESSQKDFKAKSVRNKVNHLICLGQGDLKERAVIHLFADANGGIQKYCTLENPDLAYDDIHYILDKSNQVLFNDLEIVDVYDYASADIANNYVLTEEIYNGAPADFGYNFSKYFVKDGNSYKNAESEYITAYNLMTAQPSNWASQYGNYYQKNGTEYEQVKADTDVEYTDSSEDFTIVTSQPYNWSSQYESYYYKKSDGVHYTWTKIQGDDVKQMFVQTMIPSDWAENWSKYYILWWQMKQVQMLEKGVLYYYNDNGTIKSAKMKNTGAPPWKSNTYYQRTSAGNYSLLKTKPSDWATNCTSYYYTAGSGFVEVGTRYGSFKDWKPNTYYTEETIGKKAPAWQSNQIYALCTPLVKAPAWQSNKYFQKVSYYQKPIWKRGTFYEYHQDHYKELVRGALEQMEKISNSDSISMTLPDDVYSYDVGDMVGATSDETGFSVKAQAITKKIVKIDNKGISLEYEIGGN